jgi:hypothetical protein
MNRNCRIAVIIYALGTWFVSDIKLYTPSEKVINNNINNNRSKCNHLKLDEGNI